MFWIGKHLSVGNLALDQVAGVVLSLLHMLHQVVQHGFTDLITHSVKENEFSSLNGGGGGGGGGAFGPCNGTHCACYLPRGA